MGKLFDHATATHALRRAYEDVLDNDRADGQLGAGVRRFGDDLDTNLSRLAEDLASGGYKPVSLAEVRVAKEDGGERVLHIPAVRDRIVERAILDIVTPVVDPWLGHSAYAYRPVSAWSTRFRRWRAFETKGLAGRCTPTFTTAFLPSRSAGPTACLVRSSTTRSSSHLSPRCWRAMRTDGADARSSVGCRRAVP